MTRNDFKNMRQAKEVYGLLGGNAQGCDRDIAKTKIGRRHHNMSRKSYGICHCICLHLGFRIATWPWEYLLDPAIDMLGHGDRMPRGKLIPDHHVIDTPKNLPPRISQDR